MANGLRVSVREAWAKSQSGEALLVCAYADEARCTRMLLRGALTLQQLEAILPTLPRDRAIFFYCACKDEATSAARAEQYRQRGYRRAAAIRGGVAAWQRAGLPMAGP